jgi:hypothetical protein
MIGRLAKFPVEVRHFEDPWKWMELSFPEQDLSDTDLNQDASDAFRLQIDDRKAGWKQLCACIRSADEMVQAAGFSQLSGLVLLSFSEWIWQSSNSEQVQYILEGRCNDVPFAEKSLGHTLHILLISKLGGERLIKNSLTFASIAQMANIMNKDCHENSSRAT